METDSMLCSAALAGEAKKSEWTDELRVKIYY